MFLKIERSEIDLFQIPGKSFALAEMRLVLARLLWRFDLAMAPGCQIDWNKLKTYVVVEKEAINLSIKDRAGSEG